MAVLATSLKMPDELKERIARLAADTGETPHALMLRLLDERVTAVERFKRAAERAEASHARMQKTGLWYPADEVHDYIDAKIAGSKPERPKARKWRA